MSESSKMKWVNVNDRLPPAGKDVLIRQKYYGKFVSFTGYWIPKYHSEDSSSDEWEWLDYDKENDVYYEPEGWYENQYNWAEYSAIYCDQENVTHWAYIPDELVGEINE